MANWTDELRAEIIEKYKEQEPTGDNSMEIVTEIQGDYPAHTVNSIRMMLSKAGVYVTKTPTKSAPSKTGDKPARVGKEQAHAALVSAIEAAGKKADDEIISKMTGKAALYFAEILSA